MQCQPDAVMPYPGALRQDSVVQVPLDDFGICSFYLTIRFRPTGSLIR
jgi:hypothetical protein